MSTLYTLIFIHVFVTVIGIYLAVVDTKWMDESTVRVKIGFFVVLAIPVINMVLVALMLAGFFMDKALGGTRE